MLRLHRDGHVLQIPRPKDEPYLYMPNPAIIHPESTKIRHFMAITDFYLRLGKPEIYEVEPNVDEEYRPDAYTIVGGTPTVVEIQRSYTSHKKMQAKIDAFVDTYRRGKHDAQTLWIVSDLPFKPKAPDNFRIEYLPLNEKTHSRV